VKGVCASCRKPKYEVHGKASELIPTMNVLMCKTCINKGYEPRHIVILAARSGISEAKIYIVNNLYIGEKIPAEDILA